LFLPAEAFFGFRSGLEKKDVGLFILLLTDRRE